MDLNNQSAYWDRVADEKTFTHPVHVNWLSDYLRKNALVADYGCGYGRVVRQLRQSGFTNVIGYDTSKELVNRGIREGVTDLFYIAAPPDLSLPPACVDCFLLFAVLTCIPGNDGQRQLVRLLHDRLKPGGILYVSDYYIQPASTEMEGYTSPDGNPMNYGVFSLPEGVTFRHHTREWISTLFNNFTLEKEAAVPVTTMNGVKAEAFQLLFRK